MERRKKNFSFTEGRILPRLILFVLPIIATNFLQTFYNAADMMVVSLSNEPNAVGAIGTTGPFVNLIVNVFIGFSIGANVVVARYIGAKDEARTQKAVHTALLMGVLFGLCGAGVGGAITRPVLKAMGATGSLLELAVTYTYIYFAGVPFLALTNYLIAIFRAKGDAKTPLVVLATAGLVNVGLNLFFVVAVGMSVEGVALATMISNLLSFAVLLWKLARDKDYTTFSFRALKLDKKELRAIVYIGLPAGLQGALFSISNMLIQSSIVSVNNRVCPPDWEYQPIVNGCAAAGNIDSFVYTAMNAVYQGAITFTGQNMGADKPERVKPTMYSCYLLATVIGLALGFSVLALKKPLLALYGVASGAAGSPQAMAMDAATTRLWLVCVPYFLCGVYEVGTGVLRGMGKSMISTAISLVGACLLRVVWLWTAFPLYPTLEMVFICYPTTWLLTALASYIVIQASLGRIFKERKAAQGVEKNI